MSFKYKFYHKESKIIDFLLLPLKIFGENKDQDDDELINEIVRESDREFLKKVEEKLQLFKNEIEEFYCEDISLIEALTYVHSFFGYEKIESYLESLLELDDNQIKKSIAYKFLMLEFQGDYNQEIMEKADKISSSKENMIKLIKESSIDNASKWNLFCIIENPILYVDKYVQLMYKILPIFEEIYETMEEKVISCGEGIIEKINKKGYVAIDEMTNGIVNKTILSNEWNLLISIFMPYTFSFSPGGSQKYVIWGLDMERAFEKIKEMNENKLSERITVFKNLGDKTRYEVLKLIARGITSTKDIAKALGVTSATISYHLSTLTTSKIIKLSKGNGKYGYELNYDFIEQVIEEMKEDILYSHSKF